MSGRLIKIFIKHSLVSLIAFVSALDNCEYFLSKVPAIDSYIVSIGVIGVIFLCTSVDTIVSPVPVGASEEENSQNRYWLHPAVLAHNTALTDGHLILLWFFRRWKCFYWQCYIRDEVVEPLLFVTHTDVSGLSCSFALSMFVSVEEFFLYLKHSLPHK